MDSTEGLFFYEVNAPLKCFTRFDQIEQSNNIVFFAENISSVQIDELYSKGIFYYSYPAVISNYILETRTSLPQIKSSILDFEKKLNYLSHASDSVYQKTLYYDSSKVLSFKKFSAKIFFFSLGELNQRIPSLNDYTCCYSNKKIKTKAFSIYDIKEVKVY
jgi:hypothetical protein